MKNIIRLNNAEIQSGLDRVQYAESLIKQLPKDHDGRNTWLLNYGIGREAYLLREKIEIEWCYLTRSAK